MEFFRNRNRSIDDAAVVLAIQVFLSGSIVNARLISSLWAVNASFNCSFWAASFGNLSISAERTFPELWRH